MSTVRVDLAAMFSHREPWDCSNSIANLGPRAAECTWSCAMDVAGGYKTWLLTPLADALTYIHTWACETGAWERAEVDKWTAREALALLVQNAASDLRELGSDDMNLEGCAAASEAGNEQVCMYVYMQGERVLGELCM